MSTKAKKSASTAAESNDDIFVRDLPNGGEVRLPLAIDLEQMFTLVDAVNKIDDDADVFETLTAVRAIIPPEYLEQVKGVDVGISLSIFMDWVRMMGERLGKALTTPVD